MKKLKYKEKYEVVFVKEDDDRFFVVLKTNFMESYEDLRNEQEEKSGLTKGL